MKKSGAKLRQKPQKGKKIVVLAAGVESSGKCKITKFFGRTQFWEMKSVERNHIIRVLRHTNGNKTETARLLKIGLTTLYRKIEEYGIKD